MERAAFYFENSREVLGWWNPEHGHGRRQFSQGLDIVLEEVDRISGRKNIVDVACGKGRLSLRLVPHHEVHAVDISQTMLDLVREADRRIQTVKADVTSLPFEDGTFDIAVCLEALVHFNDPQVALAEIARVVRPGGTIIFNFDNRFGAIRILKDIIESAWAAVNPRYRALHRQRRSRFRTLSRSTVESMLSPAHMRLNAVRYIGTIMPFHVCGRSIYSYSRAGKIAWLTDRLDSIPGVRRLATYIYIIATKEMERDRSDHSP